MRKLGLVLLPLCIFPFGCANHKYVKKPWAEHSLEQSLASCEMETAKASTKGHCNDTCKRDLMHKCMKAKGWEWSSHKDN